MNPERKMKALLLAQQNIICSCDIYNYKIEYKDNEVWLEVKIGKTILSSMGIFKAKITLHNRFYAMDKYSKKMSSLLNTYNVPTNQLAILKIYSSYHKFPIHLNGYSGAMCLKHAYQFDGYADVTLLECTVIELIHVLMNTIGIQIIE